jgi:raffinose/stachyose/melibiose transport system permease protein
VAASTQTPVRQPGTRASRAPARRRADATARAQRRLALLFVAPAVAVYAVFMLYPFLDSAWYSLTSWNGFGPRRWVGLSNYDRLLHDGNFWGAFRHTMQWVVVGTIAPLVIGFVLAVLLWNLKRGALPLRTIYFLPHLLPSVVLATLFGWIYNPIFGPLNEELHSLGLHSWAHGWLGEPGTALSAVLAAAIWATFGLVVLIVFAGLQHLNPDLIDAARLDGAGFFAQARHVILPGIAPVVTVVSTITLIGGFAVFDIVFVMTSGGPGNASEVLGTYTYSQAFEQNDIGYGAALSMVITVVSLIATVIFVKLRERSSRYV